jgi:preprotein translocase subunit SecG
MQTYLTVGQIIIGLVLSGLILLQAKGVGLGRSFGSSNYHSKRGVEKLTFRSTIVLAIVFTLLSITRVLV